MQARKVKVIRRASLGAVAAVLSACSGCVHRAAGPAQSEVSLQELMQRVIDPSADCVWNAVETVDSQSGENVRQPQTPAEWLEVRRAAVTLIKTSDLLSAKGRRVGKRYFPAEAAGALDSTQIQARIADEQAAFNSFAMALRETARISLAAIDAHDAALLVTAGGAIDQVCEGCHSKFWYPNQVIPALPSDPPPATSVETK